jgi:hypothetical protein
VSVPLHGSRGCSHSPLPLDIASRRPGERSARLRRIGIDATTRPAAVAGPTGNPSTGRQQPQVCPRLWGLANWLWFSGGHGPVLSLGDARVQHRALAGVPGSVRASAARREQWPRLACRVERRRPRGTSRPAAPTVGLSRDRMEWHMKSQLRRFSSTTPSPSV